MTPLLHSWNFTVYWIVNTAQNFGIVFKCLIFRVTELAHPGLENSPNDSTDTVILPLASAEEVSVPLVFMTQTYSGLVLQILSYLSINCFCFSCPQSPPLSCSLSFSILENTIFDLYLLPYLSSLHKQPAFKTRFQFFNKTLYLLSSESLREMYMPTHIDKLVLSGLLGTLDSGIF